MGDRADELISPSANVSCSLPESGRMYHTHDKSIICGGNEWGYFSLTAWKTCINLTSSGWVNTSHWLAGNAGRYHHSSWPVRDGIILIGGIPSTDNSAISEYNSAITTELVKVDGTREEAFDIKYSTTM